MVEKRKMGRLVEGSVHATKTAAGHFATGYRGARFGRIGKPRGSVKVQPVGQYWGVFDYDPQPRVRYITIAKGIKQGKRLWG